MFAERAEDVAEQASRFGFAHEAGEPEAVFLRDREREREDRGVKVQMQVAVPVGGCQSQVGEPLELTPDLRGEMAVKVSPEKISQPGHRGRWAEHSGAVREWRRPGGASGAQGEMKPDAKVWICAGQIGGGFGVRFVDHQAGLREDAAEVSADDGAVHGNAAAKIVAGEDECFQKGIRADRMPDKPTMFWLILPTPRKA